MDNITIFKTTGATKAKSHLAKQLNENYRLTTAEIFYHLPDHPSVLQSYIWQEYDIAPKFPELLGFLDFWSREIDGKLHSIYLASKELVSPSHVHYCDGELILQ